MAELPTLYSFRRCPYAMRARLALVASGQKCILREIKLKDKPAEMLELSPKGTVPILQLTNGQVIDESLDIMMWALGQADPLNWLSPQAESLVAMQACIAENDGPFKHHLDRYKYGIRYGEGTDPEMHRSEGALFLQALNVRLENTPQLFGGRPSLADFAIFPFVRQFANTDREWFEGQPLPHLHTWLEQHLNSYLFQTVFQKWPVWNIEAPDVLFPTS